MPVLLITGGAKRIGAEIIKYFAKEKWDIAFTYYQSGSHAEKLIDKLNGHNKIKAYKADLRETKTASNLIKEVNKDFQKIDLLINNASEFKEQDFLNTSIADLDNNYALHVRAPFILSKEFIKINNNARIINITDAMVNKLASKFFAYNLSKNSLSQLSKMIAKDVDDNIKIYEIAPQKILNDNNRKKIFSTKKEQENIKEFLGEIKKLILNF